MKMLGRKPAKHDPRTLKLSRYFTAELIKPNTGTVSITGTTSVQ